jgi:hypothetical protein
VGKQQREHYNGAAYYPWKISKPQSMKKESRWRQADFLWNYNTCRSIIYGNKSTKDRRGEMKVYYCMVPVLYVKWR